MIQGRRGLPLYPATRRGGVAARWFLVSAAFIVVAFVYCRPLFEHPGSRIASDPYDPALNAAVLWWNATVVPFSERWWNQPWFSPTWGVTAFTENLVGLSVIATPVYWLTGSPVFAYNVTFFASWPLSAIAVCFLVQRLTGRMDAGIVGGLVYGFSPYRIAEVGHLQSLSGYWLPVALAALHAYLENRRAGWLVLFGAAWVLQSLSNGYYMLFGAVLIALWLVYFCSKRERWPIIARIGVGWAASTLFLLPVLLGYDRIHRFYGLRRQYFEALAFSAHPDSWLQVSGFVRVWRSVLPAGSDDLFPGATAVLLVCAASIVGLSTRADATFSTPRRRLLKWVLAIVTLASAIALGVMLARGPWSLERGGIVLFRMRDPYRALVLIAACGVPLLLLSTRTRVLLERRHPFVFYGAAALIMALLACGPVLSVHDQVILDPAPYKWLMALPGFDQLRVPARFWMMGVLCLSACAGIAYARLTRSLVRARPFVLVLCCAAVLADGWLTMMPTAAAPAVWTSIAGADPSLPLLELPLGPDWDAAATFRATAHHRRVVNGVSGYDPPAYAPLQVGLRMRDPEMLTALASLGAYEIAIEKADDGDRGWRQYVEGAGATLVGGDRERVIYRMPARRFDETSVGGPLDIAAVTSSRGNPAAVFDGRIDTDWVDHPQHEDQWLLADLGSARRVGGISLAIEEHAPDFPRHLRIEVSADGVSFGEVWDGNAAPRVFLAALREPRTGWLRIGFAPVNARFVRIRQTAEATIGWRVPELQVNAPDE